MDNPQECTKSKSLTPIIALVLAAGIGAGSGGLASAVTAPDLDLAAERAESAAVDRCQAHTDKEIIKLEATLENVRLRAINESVKQSRNQFRSEITRIELRLGRIEGKLDEALSK